jgi:SAM-dependent methyltransferase
VDESVQDFTLWQAKNPMALASVEEAISKLLHSGKGVEIKCGNSLLSEKLGITQLILPGRTCLNAGSEGEPWSHKDFYSMSCLDALQLDFVFICYCDRAARELQSIFEEAHRILKNSGVLVLVFFDPNSQAAETFFGGEVQNNDASTVGRIVFELSDCGFKQFEFAQTLFSPMQKDSKAEELKPGYGEGLFVVVQARK